MSSDIRCVEIASERLAMPTALITGASRGLGYCFATRLAHSGYDLVLVARGEERLRRAAAGLRDIGGGSVEVIVADLADSGGCGDVERRLREGPLVRLLVNNAGTWSYQPFTDQTIEGEEAMLRLNVGAVMRLTHAALPRMLSGSGGGHIINVASVAGLAPLWSPSAYPASKAWVVSFSQSLARSPRLRRAGVGVTVVVPGYIRTRDEVPAEVAHVPRWMWLEPGRVAQEALCDARAGRLVSVPGRRYKAMACVLGHLPAAWTMSFTRYLERPDPDDGAGGGD
ncbi:SDR family NAD(P)-dependent oxidoreductase [Streptomyces sp. NPDC055036]